MTKSNPSKLIKENTICWMVAVVMPLIFHFGLANTKFPWPVVLPILLIAPMIASNRLIAQAAGDDDAPR